MSEEISADQVEKFCQGGGCEHYRISDVCAAFDSRVMQELAVAEEWCLQAQKLGRNGSMKADPDGIGHFTPNE